MRAPLQERYASKHPKLLVTGSPLNYPGFKVIEVYAYYKVGCARALSSRLIVHRASPPDMTVGAHVFR